MPMVIKLICQRCGYEWVPRVNDVRQCPRCKTIYWDKPKKEKGEQRMVER